MIYHDGSLGCITEAIYLEEEFDVSVSSNIHVNPGNPTYLIGKTVILNTPRYREENIKILQENRCRIISRVVIPGVDDIDVFPYILRPCFDVLWNGQEIYIESWKSFEESDNESYFLKLPDYKFYFPKITGGEVLEDYTDEGGNLTWLGWLLQQTGMNIKGDTVFTDLDLIKTKKLDFRKV